jgi:carbamate kinase
MAPKIRAALYYIKNGGKECIIIDAAELGNSSCETRIVRDK